VNVKPLLRIAAFAPAALLALALSACGGSYSAAGGAGCGGIYGNMCPPTNAPPPAMSDCSAAAPLVGPNYQVTMNLNLASCNDITYGLVRGYSAGNGSNVVKAPGGSNIVFVNNDTLYMHTADFLAKTLPFPAAYGGGVQRAASAAGTLIDDPNFSTGTLAQNGGTSAVYKVPASGSITLLGCFFYYSSGMRTVVIAQ